MRRSRSSRCRRRPEVVAWLARSSRRITGPRTRRRQRRRASAAGGPLRQPGQHQHRGASRARRPRPLTAESDGFLGRWARRKALARSGAELPPSPNLRRQPRRCPPPAGRSCWLAPTVPRCRLQGRSAAARTGRAGAASADAGRRAAAHAGIGLQALRRARGRAEVQRRVQEAVHRPALQRDGRARHLHRRLFGPTRCRWRSRASCSRHVSRQPAERALQDAAALHARLKPLQPLARTRRLFRMHPCHERRPHGTVPARRRAPNRPRPMAPGAITCPRTPKNDPLICNCNRTMPLDADALGRAIGEALVEHSTLCRRERRAFQRAVRDSGPLLVACTQEQRLFNELAQRPRRAVARAAADPLRQPARDWRLGPRGRPPPRRWPPCSRPRNCTIRSRCPR